MKRRRHRPFRLQRLARSASARLFAHAMAVLLALANFSVWAMSMPAMSGHASPPTVQAMAPASAHHHCDEMAAKSVVKHTQSLPHGHAGSCCANGACACAHVCPSALATLLPDFATYAAVRWSPPLDTSFVATAGERRLRPPIV